MTDHTPVVNLNGTSREALLEQLHAAYAAIGAAQVALDECAPHGRDYQTAEPGRYERACAVHKRRLLALQALRDELAEDYSAVLA